MPSIITPTIWTQQPQYPAEIDWGNPLTRGLVDYSTTSRNDLIASGGTKNPTIKGVAYKGNGSSTYWYKTTGVSLSAGQPFTIAALCLGSCSADTRVYAFGASSSNNPIIQIGSSSTDATKLRLFVRDNNGGGTGSALNYGTTATVFEDSKPHFAVLNYDGSALNAYVDGVYDTSVSGTNAAITTNRTAIGALLRATPAAYNASAVVFSAFWNRALTPSEIKSLSDNPWQIFRPITRRIYVDIPAATGDVTLLPGLYSNANEFYAATLTQTGGTQTLTASLFTNTNTFYSPTVTPGAVALSAPYYENANSFYAATLNQASGAQSLTASLFENTNSFYAATVAPGAVSLTASRIENSNQFFDPSVVPGGVVVSPPYYENGNTFYAPTVTPGAVALQPALFENSNTFYAPEEFYQQGFKYVKDGYVADGYVADQGAVELLASLFTNTNTFPAPLVGRFSTSDLQFLVAYMEAHMAVPTAQENAAAVLAAAQVTPLFANIKEVNSVPITGAGVPADPMRPA